MLADLMGGKAAYWVPAIAAGQRALGALDFLGQGVAFDVADHLAVGEDLVQVNRAVVEPLDVAAPGQPAVRAVAQRVVGEAHMCVWVASLMIFSF